MNNRKPQKPHEWDSRIIVTGIIHDGFIDVYIAVGPFGNKNERAVMAVKDFARKMTDDEISCNLCSSVNRAVMPFFDGEIEWSVPLVKEMIRVEIRKTFNGRLAPRSVDGMFICSDSLVNGY